MLGKSCVLFSGFQWFSSRCTEIPTKQKLNLVGFSSIHLRNSKIISSSLLDVSACVYPLSVCHLHFSYSVHSVRANWMGSGVPINHNCSHFTFSCMFPIAKLRLEEHKEELQQRLESDCKCRWCQAWLL